MRLKVRAWHHLPVLLLSLLLPLATPGCGHEVEVQSQSQAPQIAGNKEQIKARLSEIATTGSGGSAVSGLREALTELKSTEPALAEQLLSDLDRLEKLTDSNQIKTLAGRMADRL